jgi:S-adenosylmethionine hydrolase
VRCSIAGGAELLWSRPLKEAAGCRRDALIRIGSAQIRGIKCAYAEAQPGEVLAIIGSFGGLEISVARGSAADALKASTGTAVEVEQ